MSGGGGIGGAIGGAIAGPMGIIPGAVAGNNWGQITTGQLGVGGQGPMWYLPEPERPEFKSLIDPATGLLKDQYNVKLDERGLNAFRDRALSQGPSAWQNLALEKQKLDESALKDSTLQQGSSAAAQARSALASRGGLSGGAAERLAKDQMRNQMSGLQNVGFQGQQARANIGLQDEQMKNQFLQALPGQELAALQPQQFNIQNAINQNRDLNTANLSAYKDQMAAYGAKQQANAMRGTGGGGKGK